MDLQWAEHCCLERTGSGRTSKIGGDKLLVVEYGRRASVYITVEDIPAGCIGLSHLTSMHRDMESNINDHIFISQSNLIPICFHSS